MLDYNQIASEFCSGRESCKDLLISKLTNLGFLESDLSIIEDVISEIMACFITPEDVERLIEDEEDDIKDEVVEITTEARLSERSLIDDILHESHEVMNAKSSISIADPITSESRFTSPINIQDANYSVIEDYPKTYGFIDTIKNWFKINKETRHAEFVHSSKSHLKIDRDGNATLYITGNLKQVIDGDYILEVKGSHDFIVNGGKYEHVHGQVEEKYDSTKDEKVAGNVTETYGGNHDTNVSGNRNEKAATIHHN